MESFPEHWARALAVVAHPDDMEYGAAAAVARWTGLGKRVSYALVTSGEAGIADQAPDEVGPLREAEQRAGCAVVGVDDVSFLGFPDGLIESGPALRKAIAAEIRRTRPEVVVTIHFGDRWGDTGPYNHVDHRVVGLALIDAVRDAANPWLFRDLPDPAWDGVELVAVSGSGNDTHFVDVSDTIDKGVQSLEAHAAYLAGLGDNPMADAGTFLREAAAAIGARVGCKHAAGFELIPA